MPAGPMLPSKALSNDEKLRGLNFAQLMYKNKNYEGALRKINDYLTVKTDSAEGYHLLGQIYEKQDKRAQALEAYKRCYLYDKSRHYLDLLPTICKLHAEEPSDHDSIRTWLQKAEKQFPNHPDVRKLRDLLVNSREDPLNATLRTLSNLNINNSSNLNDSSQIYNNTMNDSLLNLSNNQNQPPSGASLSQNLITASPAKLDAQLKSISRTQEIIIRNVMENQTMIKKTTQVSDSMEESKSMLQAALDENKSLMQGVLQQINQLNLSISQLQTVQNNLLTSQNEMKTSQNELKVKMEALASELADRYDVEECEEEEEDLEDEDEGNNENNNSSSKPSVFDRLGGFGNQFAPPPGSWKCNACYLDNKPDATICISCETPKPGAEVKPVNLLTPKSISFGFKPSQSATSSANTSCIPLPSFPTFGTQFTPINNPPLTQSSAATPSTSATDNSVSTAQQLPSNSFGNMFAKPAGSWECTTCYVNNAGTSSVCASCETPKPGSKPPANQPTQNMFSFGVPSTSSQQSSFSFTNNITTPATPAFQPSFGFGTPSTASTTKLSPMNLGKDFNQKNLFNASASEPSVHTIPSAPEPSPLEQLERNVANLTQSTMQNKPSSIFSTPSASSSFMQTGSMFSTPGSMTISAGPTSATTAPTSISTSFPSFSSFGFASTSQQLNLPSFGIGSSGNQPIFGPQPTVPPSSSSVATSSASLTLQPFTSSFTFNQQTAGGFNFQMPLVSTESNKLDTTADVDDHEHDDHHGEVDEVENSADIHFTPVIPLPPKVDVKTGEEGEEVIFSHRAKLHRFSNGEWKERGLGDIKVLKNPETGKYRLLMRREQIHKVCLNHQIMPDLMFTEKSVNEPKQQMLQWTATDFSDGEPTPWLFCVRFKEPAVRNTFMDEVLKIVKGTTTSAASPKKSTATISTPVSVDDDECKVVYVKQPSEEARAKARHLNLPDNFFSYSEYKPCPGCMGCEDRIPMLYCETETGKAEKVKQTDNKQFVFGSLASVPTSNLFSVAINEQGTKSGWASSNKHTPPKWMTAPVKQLFSGPSAGNDNEDDPEAEANVTFKPVVPLPDLIEVKTGEEDEKVLFSYRAKLYRHFDKEWKERGTGEVKILKDAQTNKVRLLMRRDQIHKVCLNHQLTKELSITFRQGSDTILQWTAVDFSENVAKPECFALRFKLPDTAKQFLDVIEHEKQLI